MERADLPPGNDDDNDDDDDTKVVRGLSPVLDEFIAMAENNRLLDPVLE